MILHDNDNDKYLHIKYPCWMLKDNKKFIANNYISYSDYLTTNDIVGNNHPLYQITHYRDLDDTNDITPIVNVIVHHLKTVCKHINNGEYMAVIVTKSDTQSEMYKEALNEYGLHTKSYGGYLIAWDTLATGQPKMCVYLTKGVSLDYLRWVPDIDDHVFLFDFNDFNVENNNLLTPDYIDDLSQRIDNSDTETEIMKYFVKCVDYLFIVSGYCPDNIYQKYLKICADLSITSLISLELDDLDDEEK